jgi:hypothetical protein
VGSGRAILRPMRRLALLTLLTLAGCGKHEAPPDPLVKDLSGAITATIAAMGEAPLEPRAVDDEALRLAWQADHERLDAVRRGAVTADAQEAAARGVMRRIRAAKQGVEPPKILAWLADHAAQLTPEQRLLLEAASEQAERELPAEAKR